MNQNLVLNCKKGNKNNLYSKTFSLKILHYVTECFFISKVSTNIHLNTALSGKLNST